MLPKQVRMTKTKDFAVMATKGRTVFGPYATLRVRPATAGDLKIAFIVSTKIFKKAVDRNRAKRRFRAAVKEAMPQVPAGNHYLFILKPETLTEDYSKMKEEVIRLFSKVPEAVKQPAKISPRARKEFGKGKIHVGARFIKPKNTTGK